MPSKTELALDKFFKKIEKFIGESKSANSIRPTAEFAISVIVKRTRLGYGVKNNFGTKERLKPLTARYVQQRRTFSLFDLTSPKTSNLTRTGQLLSSVKIIKIQNGVVTIGPQGRRDDGKDNAKIAGYQEKQGRTFNRISSLEYNQILRFYRRTFTDLLQRITR